MAKEQDKIIELKNVGVTYKERKSFFKYEYYQALKDVSFDVYKGETLGVIGRNGAGKSTLLRLLAGIIKPDKGAVIHHCRSVSLMALAAGFDPNLSGRQNAIISGMLIGYSKRDIIEKLDEIKLFSELQNFFEKPVKIYSSGMRARLAFSIAIYVSPDVLLIDEVLGVGDVSFKQKAEQALEEKIASDITVIIVSHSEHQISRLAPRVVWIDAGKVRKQGLAEEVFAEYNLNSKFSTFGLQVEKFTQNYDYLFWFEQLEVVNDQIRFNCVVIDQKDRQLGHFTSMVLDKKISELKGPTQTPGYKARYPHLQQATKARYHNGLINIGQETILIIEADGVEAELLRIKIKSS
ncbi:ABC transporter ATP-binding protein [Vibrio sp. dsl-7]|uniref:ABC transporter ATP-binding protein n=1 Tax=Vibrio chanodichtyis TaxID=3027932 RepID=A0ABT5V288_9VIBR|nr:ABC transporter ATP-binding protein [Vibrio chanodichtyis]MDE1515553.1 ABC transporter ATP-binding protein [Vibrio chanodichtyis]